MQQMSVGPSYTVHHELGIGLGLVLGLGLG